MKARTIFTCLISLACLGAPLRADINILSPSFGGRSGGDDRPEREGGDGDRERRECALRLPECSRVDLTAAVGKDFIGSDSFHQAAGVLGTARPFVGLGWEAIFDRVGIGGQYLASFSEDGPDEWWLDWNGQAVYLSYHMLGAKTSLDPFVEGGIGCAGRVYLGPDQGGEWRTRLAIQLYPFAGAGASLRLDGIKVGAKVDYAIARSAIPATWIPEYPLGRFQLTAFAGFCLGSGRSAAGSE